MANAIQIQSGGTAYKIKDSLARSATIANIFNVQDWENGAINETNGTNASSSERIRLTGYLPATAKDLSSANSNIRFIRLHGKFFVLCRVNVLNIKHNKVRELHKLI